jgi:hypothetical protein
LLALKTAKLPRVWQEGFWAAYYWAGLSRRVRITGLHLCMLNQPLYTLSRRIAVIGLAASRSGMPIAVFGGGRGSKFATKLKKLFSAVLPVNLHQHNLCLPKPKGAYA